MSTQVQFRRGPSAQTALFTGATGEIVVDTDQNTISVQDGHTQGGIYLAKQSDMILAFSQSNSNIANISLLANAAYSQSNTAIHNANIALQNSNNALMYVSANVIQIASVNSTQNTNITITYNLAQSAFNKANSIPTSQSVNSSMILAQSAYDTANLASQRANSVHGGSF